MHLEPATSADLPAVHALIESAYRGDSARAGWTHEADLLDGQRTDLAELEGMLADENRQLLVLRNGEMPAACVALTDQRDGLTYLGMLTVHPERQAGGVGRLMLAAAEEHARMRFAAATVEMTVIAQRRELISWYVRRGYRLTGERRPFPYAKDCFGPPRSNELEFVALAKRL